MKAISTNTPIFLLTPAWRCTESFACDAYGLLHYIETHCPYGVDSIKLFNVKNNRFQKCSKANVLVYFTGIEREWLQKTPYFQ
jgi:hypothetical protein